MESSPVKAGVVLDGEDGAADCRRLAEGGACRQAAASAAGDSGLTFVCIQVKEHSLAGFTADDAVVY